MIQHAQDLERHLQTQLGRVLFGANDAIHQVCIALVGRGHVLLEGPPGVGKTLLGKSLAEVLRGNFRRVQGTADLMPTDITGVHVYNARDAEFAFQPGPVFADVLLVDEINRAGPKTQSALLEAMEERQVTVDRETFTLADDFLVIATQNPREFEGTYPLPESQLDRFMLNVAISYPAKQSEAEVVSAYNLPQRRDGATTNDETDEKQLQPLPTDALHNAQAALADVHLAPELINYALDIAIATRERRQLSLGLSSRGAIALTRCARIEAALAGDDYVVPDHVKRVAPWVANHRLAMTPDAALEGAVQEAVLAEILAAVPVPR